MVSAHTSCSTSLRLVPNMRSKLDKMRVFSAFELYLSVFALFRVFFLFSHTRIKTLAAHYFILFLSAVLPRRSGSVAATSSALVIRIGNNGPHRTWSLFFVELSTHSKGSMHM